MKTQKNVAIGILTVASTLFAANAALGAEPLKLAISNWATGKVVGNIARYVIETKLNQPVEAVTTDIGIQFEGVARGDIDLMVNGWLPTTHAAYYAKYKDRIVDQGVIFGGARNGWAVPTYVPESELASIEDLKKPEVKDKLDGTIQTIEPGSGLAVTSEKALKEYGLDGYRLQPSSEAGMLAALSRGYSAKKWIVATVWSPHWLFQKWSMRYLADPKHALGGEEANHGFSSRQFDSKFPRVSVFMKHFKLSVSDVEKVALEGNASNNFPAAAKAFVDSHPDQVKSWLQQ
jgi:glycine betaine/proline transport system substrate-binding protein